MSGCSCKDCVSACQKDPGRLIPSDLPKIAAKLKISVSELVDNYLVKKKYSHKNITVIIPAPAKLKGKNLLCQPGKIAPDYYEEEKGRCIFLSEDGLCAVHDVKPYECSAYMGCKNTFLGRPYKTKMVEDFFISKWRGVMFS